jgi:hypothetical protein
MAEGRRDKAILITLDIVGGLIFFVLAVIGLATSYGLMVAGIFFTLLLWHSAYSKYRKDEQIAEKIKKWRSSRNGLSGE